MANTMHLRAARPRAYTFDGLGDGPEQLALGLAAGDVLGTSGASAHRSGAHTRGLFVR
jgi:hypothetical protein